MIQINMSKCNAFDSESVLNNIRIVRSAGLPYNETGFSRITSYPEHRCDIDAEGISIEYGQHPYDFDNRKRNYSVLFQSYFATARALWIAASSCLDL